MEVAGEAQRLADRTFEALADLLEQGRDVGIYGFGTFEVRLRKERRMVNPLTGKQMLVPPRLGVGFRPSEGSKRALSANE